MPITAVDIPIPRLADLADGYKAFADAATTMDANFALVNAAFSTPAAAMTYQQSSQLAGYSVVGAQSTAVNLPASVWPPFTFMIPNPCVAVLLHISAQIDALANAATVYFNLIRSGTGIKVSPTLYMEARNNMFRATKGYLFTAADLTPGASVTYQPQAWWYNAAPSGNAIGSGQVELFAFTGAAR